MPIDDACLARMAKRAGLAPVSIAVSPAGPGEFVPAGVDAHLPLYPASTIKTPLVACTLLEVAAGRLSLDDVVAVTAANMTVNDAASPLLPGYRAGLREICELCIQRSDNVATNMLFDVVGRERATELSRSRLGLMETAFYRKLSGSDPLIADPQWDGVHRNTHTAADSAHLYRSIARDEFPLAGELLRMLERQIWNEKLSLGLRDGDRFAHKTGDTSEVSHDGGILATAGGRRIVVVVHTGMASCDETSARFGPFMRALREQLGP